MPELPAPDWRHQLPDAVLALEWDPPGTRLAAGCLAGDVVTFELAGGAKSNVAVLETDVLSVGWSSDGAFLAAGGSDGTLGLWTNGAARTLLGLGRWAGAIAWARDRPVLAVAAGANAYVIDTEGAVRAEYLLHPGYVNDVAWEPSGDLLVASVGGIRFYDTDVSGRDPVAFAASTGTILKLAPSPDGALVAAGKSNGCVVVWKLDGGTGTVLSGSDGGVANVSWSADGGRLAVAAMDELTIWRCRDGEMVTEGMIHCAVPVGCPGGVSFHPWRNLIAWGGEDGVVCLWTTDNHDEPLTQYRVDGDITCLAWHPLGDRLAVGTTAGIVACLAIN